MAGRMIRVISAHVASDVEKSYGIRDDSFKQFEYWKRQVRKREEPVFEHDPNNFWSQQHIFFMFFMLLGNGFDTLPHSMRFALRISGGLFIFSQFIFSLLITMPLLYTELFLGKYSSLTNSQMYKMIPLSFGMCVLTIMNNILYTAFNSPQIAISLMGAMDNLLKSHTECPPGSTYCYDYKTEGLIKENCTYEHMMLNCGGQKRLLVSYYYFWSDYRNIHSFKANWSLIIVTIITWLVIIIIVNFKMKILELILKIMVILTVFMHLLLFLLAMTSSGSAIAMLNLIEFKIKRITLHGTVLTAFLMPVKHNIIYGGGFMTYAASMKFDLKLGFSTTAMLLLLANLAMNIYLLTVFHAILGVVGDHAGVHYKQAFFPFVGMYSGLVTEFLRSKNCPHVFIALYHLSNWVLECVKLTIIIRMHINSLLDFFPTIVQFKMHTRIAWVGVCSFVGLLDTMGFCIKFFNEIMWMANLYMVHNLQLFIRSSLLFYGYGVLRLNDDIHFFCGTRPVKMWRTIWYIYPVMIFVLQACLFLRMFERRELVTNFIAHDFEYNALQDSFIIICVCLSCVIFLGMFLISFLYVILQMRTSKRITLTTPLFHWGPPNREERIARKAFTPRVSIRSQPLKKQRHRFRENSVRQQHERDNAEKVKRGRLFLDKEFFSNLGLRKRKDLSKTRVKSMYSKYAHEFEKKTASPMKIIDSPGVLKYGKNT